MDLVVLDFETYWAQDYTLSKMTTEAYVRDPRFETIILGAKVNSQPTIWVPRDDVPALLRDLKLGNKGVCCHHAHFDGFIMHWHYNVRPKQWFDTLGMARALYGANGRLSLDKLCERENIGRKGDEVMNAKGKRFDDFTPEQLVKYAAYCCNDVDKTFLLWSLYAPQFIKSEHRIHDKIIRMFTEPILELDQQKLSDYADWLGAEKATLLLQAGVQLDSVMSNEKFAEALRNLGIDPPRKLSPTTGKPTWAFAKTDYAMQQLQEHDDPAVQTLVEARLKNKTTLAERGARRLIEMGKRGAATVYLKYSGASGTHRLSGGDSFNWQSMKRGSDLRNSVEAPDGSVCVVVDSSTIEARMLDWISGQDDMVEVYRKQDNKTGPDMYCVIAGHIYERAISKANDPDERQMGKRVKLGLGFGMGENQFAISVRREAKGADGKPLILSPEFTRRVVHDVYRKRHPAVVKFWRRCEDALRQISRGEHGLNIDYRGIVKTCKDGLVLPNGMKILYPELRFDPTMEPDPNKPGEMIAATTRWGAVKGEWTFWNGKSRERIYGPKVTENIIQALARIVVFSQCLSLMDELAAEGIPARWAHSVHDEGVFVVPEFFATYAMDVAMKWFRTPLDWCVDLPLNCEAGINKRYGLAKK